MNSDTQRPSLASPVAPPVPSRSPLAATTAYYRSLRGLGLMRFLLAACQRLWPALAVRAACRIFLTPLPLKWLNRGKAWGTTWSATAWPFEDASITLYSMETPGPMVLLVHGWGGHAGQMRALADALAAGGMRPVILEMPGHGHSAGWQSSLPQFARAIDYVTARLGPMQALLAHSLGASASAHVAGRCLPVERLVLLAPAASPSGYTRMFAHVFGLAERTRAAMQARIEAREGMLMAQFEPAAAGPRVRVPTLVVHDRNDTINGFADGQAYAQAVSGAQLLATEGLGHRAILKDAQVIARVVAFSGGR
ncbi:MAG: alpha/beta hydrolase [Telluria sp.]|nr:alpha/beta hydrolase [Telluria sp.]